MNRFLQLHMLTSYPPSNLNRDDLGRPKTAVIGGAMRLRISSQSLKRAWRKSEVFESALKGNVGTRTKEKGVRIYRALLEKGVAEKNALEWAKSIAGVFGKLKKPNEKKPQDALEIEQLAHFSPEEEAAIDELIAKLAADNQAPSAEDLKLLRQHHTAADIALFGRMLASAPNYNMEAAAQVAHAISVHKVQVEDDFFTAVDDLNLGEEDMGAGHMGETEFGAAVYYLYVCINRELLLDNLGGNTELANKTLAALIESITTIAPTGKQNSFASRAYASYVLAEKGDRQPRSLSVAFLKPIYSQDMLTKSIQSLQDKCTNIDKVYGKCAVDRYRMNAETGEGSLQNLIAFSTAE